MGRTTLIVGATGNTGQEVVRTLSKLLAGQDHRIIALTRHMDSDVVNKLSKYEAVEFEEINWTDIDAEWLEARSINRAFIAPQNGASQFADESAFHLALLQAGVRYVVRTATGLNSMYPSCPIWYGRNHWAIQTLLQSSDFKDLAFTSLCPNTFTATYLSTATEWVKEYRKTGKQTPLNLSLDENAKVAMIDPNDVGKVAAHLLALDDYTKHNGQAYVLAGPEDVTGRDIIKLVEGAINTSVENVNYRNLDFLHGLAEQGVIPGKFVKAMIGGMGGLWDGSSSHAKVTTSDAILELAPPSSTVRDAFQNMVGQIDP